MSYSQGTLVIDGRFRILRSLGRGGMGEVYLGEQVSLDRKVAIKVLHQAVTAQPQMQERFRREAKLLSTVDHASVVRVIDFGDDAGQQLLVMDLVEGVNLKDLLDREGPIVPDRALRLLHQLADGLAAIHEKGIIHRDLKPENVVLTQSPRGELAKLLDFGIAKLVERENTGPSVTQDGLVLGTPEYVSPEQAMGNELDARSDIYSFATLAYRMLAGRLPFDGPAPRQFMAQHAAAPPRHIELANPALRSHPPLCALIMRCLEKDARNRPQTALELSSALEAMRIVVSGPWPAVSGSQAAIGAAAPHPPSPMTQTSPQAQPSAPPPSVATNQVSANSVEPAKNVVASEATPSAKRTRRTALIIGAAAVFVAIVVTALVAGGDSTAALVRTALEQGRPKEALNILTLAEREKKLTPELKQLKAITLHGVKEHRQELELLEKLGPDGFAEPEALLFPMLASHYAENPKSGELKKVIGLIPKEQLQAGFEKRLTGPVNDELWGALRYLDLEAKSLEGKARVKAYARALQHPSCEVRDVAISRLEKLGDASAADALEQIPPGANSGGVKGFFDDLTGDDCGRSRGKKVAAALRKK